MKEENKKQMEKMNEDFKNEIKQMVMNMNKNHEIELQKLNKENTELKIKILNKFIIILKNIKYINFLKNLNIEFISKENINKKRFDSYGRTINDLFEKNNKLNDKINNLESEVVDLKIENDKIKSELSCLKILLKRLLRNIKAQ